MKKAIFSLLLLFTAFTFAASAQNTTMAEKYGKTLNLGLGIGYYGYAGGLMPVFHADYELDVARNFTLAPFINFYSYSNSYYWGNKNYPYGYYYNHVTVVPIGVKGAYYFDQLIKANTRWDFYAAGSVGFAIVNSRWDNGYYGDKNYYRRANPLFVDIHAGAEYHLAKRLGVFLDISTGVSTVGLAIH